MSEAHDLSAAFQALSSRLGRWREQVRDRRALPESDVSDLRRRLAAYTFQEPRPLESLVSDVADLLERWTVHTTHPGYFGLFNANVHDASVVADAMAAGYNPQVGLWSHSPAANEIEKLTLAYFSRAFGFDPETCAAHFTTGGSEANFTAVAAALTRAFPTVGTQGLRSLPGPPVFYVSREAHHSLEKSAHLLGLGREAVRWVATDEAHRMDPDALAEALQQDRSRGALPFLLVGTAGTTTLGSVDPLPELAALARRESLWFHVDAAWGGAAVLSPRLREHVRGIEAADSITCDAHKWLSVSMGAGMLFCRHPEALLETFQVNAPYVTGSIRNPAEPFTTTLQWSRRFIGLKLFMTMAQLGEQGMVEAIEHQAAMGRRLRTSLESHGWIPAAPSPFPLVCFTHPALQQGRLSIGDVVERVYRRGRAWISESKLPTGEPMLRACICNYKTEPQDVDILVQELNAALENGQSEQPGG